MILTPLLTVMALCAPQTTGPPSAANPLELTPEVRSFVDYKVDRTLLPMPRLEALVTAVFQDSALGFGYAPETRSAAETFASRGGNCLSFTILFIAMARHLELDARFREVEIAPSWSKNGMFVSLNKHVNAAVFIGGQGYVVDVFPGVNRIEVGGQVVGDERGLAHYYNNKGVDALGRGRLEEAESYLRRALQADPCMALAWINLGVAHNHAGQLAEAESCYRKALELNPEDLAAISNLAVVCERSGRLREARRYLTRAREFREKNPYHHFGLGQQAFESGRYLDSIAHYKKALRLKSSEHHFHFALARAYAQLDRPEEAIRCLQRALKYAPDALGKSRYSRKLELLQARQVSHS